ncbi:MAG: GIY-YIG nuclease family protein [Rikenellaceae bacterium]
MTNRDNRVLYVGVTSNLRKRVLEHKNHLQEGFTDNNNCEKLLYYEEYCDIREAIQREKVLKRC